MTDEKERPRHLSVIGTRYVDTGTKMRELLAEVPLHWDFEGEEGQALMRYMDEQVKAGRTPESLAEESGMPEVADVYRVWSHD